MAMRVPGLTVLMKFQKLLAQERLVLHRRVEPVDEDDIDGAVRRRGREAGEGAGRKGRP